MKIIEWFAEAENSFFTMHVLAVFAVAFVLEYLEPTWTTLTFPAVLLLAAASFMWNYPAESIKSHGLFSEYLIELRVLWLVILGLISEYVIIGLLEKTIHTGMLLGAVVIAVVLVLASRSRLQEKLVKARGFK
ncbi:hypothetical protein AUJ14_00320 [Candidatus Micrarchaeota archaeon CG1_02_55_22]|nr:MAG: hypothetical protein AUJ14_00320 [Candidatus Micrarchaeota archaeon CG1_02_55_22]